jgi:pyruvate formate lyase activating enzyme
MDRRQFITGMAKLGFAVAILPRGAEGATPPDRGVHLPPSDAEYFRPNADGSITCGLCPHAETLRPGDLGLCRVRQNVGGALKTHAVGQPCVVAADPVEKNPLAHVLPGSSVFAVAHAGCNLRCQYCQNWQFSQESPRDTHNLEFTQGEALGLARQKSLVAVTFTYTEGTSSIEFNKRFAAAARRLGLKAFLCSNGYVQPQPLADFLQVLDAVTVTIKGFSNEFYKATIGGASVQPVLASCRQIQAAGKWIEIATLVIPGLNDGDAELTSIARWVSQNLGRDTPWHIERFTPKYRLMNIPQTPIATLEKAQKIGLAEGLRYVYISNLAPHPANHTYCASCHQPVIRRLGFKVLANALANGRCPHCRAAIPGIWA